MSLQPPPVPTRGPPRPPRPLEVWGCGLRMLHTTRPRGSWLWGGGHVSSGLSVALSRVPEGSADAPQPGLVPGGSCVLPSLKPQRRALPPHPRQGCIHGAPQPFQAGVGSRPRPPCLAGPAPSPQQPPGAEPGGLRLLRTWLAGSCGGARRSWGTQTWGRAGDWGAQGSLRAEALRRWPGLPWPLPSRRLL